MKSIIRHTTILLVLIMAASLSGVWAIWQYSEDPVVSVTGTISVIMPEWSGEEILPDDGELGEDHATLLNNIVNHEENGLNAADSYLNTLLNNRENIGRTTLGSTAVLGGADMQEAFGTTEGGVSENIYFLLEMVGEDTIYMYTVSGSLGERGSCNTYSMLNTGSGSPTTPIGDYIPSVYRTEIQSIDGVWTIVETLEGYAESAWYDENQADAYKNITQIPSLATSTWVEGVYQEGTVPQTVAGDTEDQAIAISNNEEVTVDCGDTAVWYTVTIENKQNRPKTYTVSPNPTNNCEIVYEGTTYSYDDGEELTFTVARRITSTFTFSVKSCGEITFTVEQN